jgi:cell division FtsZ-interacting protein ZapD
VNLEDYTLIHKAEYQHLKLEIKRLEAQISDLMDTTELKRVWAAEGAIKKMDDFLKAGQQLADRRHCTCVRYADTLPTKSCLHCSTSISIWNDLIGEGPQ